MDMPHATRFILGKGHKSQDIYMTFFDRIKGNNVTFKPSKMLTQDDLSLLARECDEAL
jgi:hypothetical protein